MGIDMRRRAQPAAWYCCMLLCTPRMMSVLSDMLRRAALRRLLPTLGQATEPRHTRSRVVGPTAHPAEFEDE